MLTPQGKVVDLPVGATPVDFAYAVHTSLGHRCRGARVDGAMVPLNHVLKNGQRVEIVAAKQGGPSRDWLNPELGYAHSHRARTKVRQWFKAQQHEETLAQGRAIVERELQRAGATAVNLDAVAAKAGYAKAEELYAAAARDELNLRQIQTAIRAVVQPAAAPLPEAVPEALARQSKAAGAGSGILVVGVDRLLTNLARCCKPAPPDGIVGFVTRGKGVSIHRQSCGSVARMRAREPERLIDADWGKPRDEVFPVDVVLEAMDRQGLLRDVTESLLARADQRHGGQHADAQQRDANGVHAGGEEPRCARPRAPARQGRERRIERPTALSGLSDVASAPRRRERGTTRDLGSGPACDAVRHFGAGRTDVSRSGLTVDSEPRTGAQLQPADCKVLPMQRSAGRQHGSALARSLQGYLGLLCPGCPIGCSA